MDREITILLARRFPFFDPAKNPGTSFFYEGFLCGNGWLRILVELAASLEKLDLDKLEIGQVKEKFWTLVIYIDVEGRDEVQACEYIDEAERKSYFICEACGEAMPLGREKHSCKGAIDEDLLASANKLIRGTYKWTV